MTQTEVLLSYMRHYGSVTPLEAALDLGCMRLAARVHELRRSGHNIKTEWYKTSTGKQVASYKLVN